MIDSAYSADVLWQLWLLAAEALIISALLLGMFQLRSLFGMSMLYLALGVFQHMQVLLAVSIYVELAPGILVSPGSAVLFTASLFTVLLVYIKEGLLEARRLVYGLMVANLVLSVLTVLFGLHLESDSTLNLQGLPREIFVVNPRVLVVGTLVLFIDVLVLIVVFDALTRWLPRFLFARMMLTMAVVVTVDSVLFTTGSFFGQDRLATMMLSNIVGKLFASVLFAAAFAAYIQRLDRSDISLSGAVTALDVFQLFTYRERFEQLQASAERDSLTGAFNRGHFDRRLGELLERARRSDSSVVLALIDIDHFKQINDRFGHTVGDQVLRRLVGRFSAGIRDQDVLCRYGGEEFALLLPDAGLDDATQIVERMRRAMVADSVRQGWLDDARPVTFSAGLAAYPTESSEAQVLIDLADRRLYAGKRLGRNRVVASSDDEESAPEQPVSVS